MNRRTRHFGSPSFHLASGAGMPHILPGAAALLIYVLASATPALGIPAFARKYGTSCLTCHTVFPKLTPFGEAFRRNGFRFPGVDSDFMKGETVPLGQEAQKKQFPNAVWPGILPASVPIAVGFNGQATLHPDKKSAAALADNKAGFNLSSLVEEGHIWAGGSMDDQITFFGEMTVAEDGTEVELANVHFNDVVGPKHAINLVAGKFVPTLSSSAPHSTYLADAAIPSIFATALYGAGSSSWATPEIYNGLELNGTLHGRCGYAAGVNSGANIDVRTTDDYYGQLEYKLGGLRLDGEDSTHAPDPRKPWAENSLALDAFYYRSVSHYGAADSTILRDEAKTFGGGIHAQLSSLALDLGAYRERHYNPAPDVGKVDAVAEYSEISYVLFPWLVPAARMEYLSLKPAGEKTVHTLRIMAGADALVRPNLKLTLNARTESATGAPPGGWAASGSLVAPETTTSKVSAELEVVTIGLVFAF